MNTAALSSASRRSAMLSLLIKDLRLCTPALIASAIALILPPIAMFLGRLLGDGLPYAVHPNDVFQFRKDLANFVVLGMGLAGFTLPVVAAVALARERRDRSGEFLRTLPIPRGSILISKIIVGALWILALGAVAITLIELIRPGDDGFWVFQGAPLGEVLIVPSFFVGMIGAAWCLASFLRSEVIAAAIAIGASLALFVLLFSLRNSVFHWGYNALQANAFLTLISAIFLIIAITGFASGCLISLRRRSP